MRKGAEEGDPLGMMTSEGEKKKRKGERSRSLSCWGKEKEEKGESRA